MPKTIFRGARLSFFEPRMKEGNMFVRAHIECDYTDTVAYAMHDWPFPIPDSVKTCKLEGNRVVDSFVFTPNDKACAQYELQMTGTEIGKFEAPLVKNKGNGQEERKLRFILKTNAPDAETYWGQFQRHVGDMAGELKVTYAEQDELFSPDDAVPVESAEATEATPITAGKRGRGRPPKAK